ncbi:hypothetical protein [Cloacibacillus porcorum]|uniref:hypothetical protein n=1 Tax=Cloacibacillus porcorum TaxID=1197717 RepID=UPI003F11C53E
MAEKTIYICDCCGKEITDEKVTPYYVTRVGRGTNFLFREMLSPVNEDDSSNQKHFCATCFPTIQLLEKQLICYAENLISDAQELLGVDVEVKE